MFVYLVRNRDDLLDHVIPFFESNSLLSPKQDDFEKFAHVVRQMSRKAHLKQQGFIDLLHVAYSMNRGGLYRKQPLESIVKQLESSTTIR